ncbi:hypothetical protein BVG19_g800 [[Candida] boidinii]|nr:hypothetical protein BVG19_g800 [[Candida] boidinii]OWB50812.1 hypothetical protein B5S27_g2365 [[Candida] boidinii]OWB66152.1 hypothetical protein B5S30_g1488 [[Candida] boidinii]OWB84688.1 hypothetical protein B5S33_g3338 [[Candida] boidinii]
MPKLEEWEIKKYWQIFSSLNPVDNKLSGDKVSVVFKNSHLTDDKLSKIWDLADIDVDGSLDFEEFCIAMRLIFDIVNGDVTSVPDKLPNWLIPSSKSHLVQADLAVRSGSNNDATSVSSLSDGEDEELSLNDDFDWYISPTDKQTYETIYDSSCDRYGRIKFDSLNGLYATLKNVPETAISSAWNIVNPKQYETIDKDQCLVLLHLLNQRSNGKRLPRSVPASLRATFSKETPQYDLNSSQANLTPQSVNNSNSNGNMTTTKQSFASDYLSKLGNSNHSAAPSEGTDFSATKGTDWEEVRLRRELNDLEELLKKAEDASKKRMSPDKKDDKIAMEKYEYEQLLQYKNSQLTKISLNGSSNGFDLKSIVQDIDLVESQVKNLESFLVSKKDELLKLREEVSNFS